MEINKIYNMDAIEFMKKIDDRSVDMILCDLPYGTTDCSWDEIIPFEPMWKEMKRISKDKCAMVFTASQPFTTKLINSNFDMFRYELIWDKVKPSGMFNANKMPMKSHENILIFYHKLPFYNPQKSLRDKKSLRPNRVKNSLRKQYKSSDVYIGKKINFSDSYEEDKINPKSIIKISNINNFSDKRIHPTQKPVALFEYLIKTYTNEGEEKWI
jgi:site-specific DNA-methyltransferase (adenine-specific)|tara:strand:+ start:45 stop:683 length:639 start_codon:yes stop_codon:yes gene_type:complete